MYPVNQKKVSKDIEKKSVRRDISTANIMALAQFHEIG